ncbi:MAG TPA: hypothetical protein VIQ00_03490 [Chitinophagaceae bacterium]
MKPVSFYTVVALVSFCLITMPACSQKEANSIVTYWGSTPGDSLVKSWLKIPQDSISDFIRWQLNLDERGNTFHLQLLYGKSQPNTSGFWGGGKSKEIKGNYNLVSEREYKFHSPDLREPVSFIKVGENLFHLLAPDKSMLNGNGGWSYTLNRKIPVTDTFSPIAFKSPVAAKMEIFQGRTPCEEIAEEANMGIKSPCYKLKWLLTLHRDSLTLTPTYYSLKRTQHRQAVIEGKWLILTENNSYPGAIIQLDPDKPGKSIFFLWADNNILFFLDRNMKLLTGNYDFSYTLDRK